MRERAARPSSALSSVAAARPRVGMCPPCAAKLSRDVDGTAHTCCRSIARSRSHFCTALCGTKSLSGSPGSTGRSRAAESRPSATSEHSHWHHRVSSQYTYNAVSDGPATKLGFGRAAPRCSLGSPVTGLISHRTPAPAPRWPGPTPRKGPRRVPRPAPTAHRTSRPYLEAWPFRRGTAFPGRPPGARLLASALPAAGSAGEFAQTTGGIHI